MSEPRTQAGRAFYYGNGMEHDLLRDILAIEAEAAGLDPANPVTERLIAEGIADVVERRGEEWFDGMRYRGEYLELAARILEEISRRAAEYARLATPEEPTEDYDDENDIIPIHDQGQN